MNAEKALWRYERHRMPIAITLALLLVAIVCGARYQPLLSTERVLAAVMRERWLGQGPEKPHSAADHGVYVFTPASPLTLFDRGGRPFVGVGAWLEAHKINSFVYRTLRDADRIGIVVSKRPAEEHRLTELEGAQLENIHRRAVGRLEQAV